MENLLKIILSFKNHSVIQKHLGYVFVGLICVASSFNGRKHTADSESCAVTRR